MNYSFEILGVSPILYFFNHQVTQTQTGVEYLGTHKCTLDAFIESVEHVPANHGWDLEELVDAIIDFWINNPERIGHWRSRLTDAGNENLLVARVGSLQSLRNELESLLKPKI